MASWACVVAMRASLCLFVWLLCSAAALGHVNYASVRAQAGNAYVEKAHEMASAVNVLMGLSKETSALIAAIKGQCA